MIQSNNESVNLGLKQTNKNILVQHSQNIESNCITSKNPKNAFKQIEQNLLMMEKSYGAGFIEFVKSEQNADILASYCRAIIMDSTIAIDTRILQVSNAIRWCSWTWSIPAIGQLIIDTSFSRDTGLDYAPLVSLTCLICQDRIFKEKVYLLSLLVQNEHPSTIGAFMGQLLDFSTKKYSVWSRGTFWKLYEQILNQSQMTDHDLKLITTSFAQFLGVEEYIAWFFAIKIVQPRNLTLQDVQESCPGSFISSESCKIILEMFKCTSFKSFCLNLNLCLIKDFK